MADEQVEDSPPLSRKVTYRFRLVVWHSGIQTDGIEMIQSDTPFGAVQKGDWIYIGDVRGRTESRLATGRVREISHSFCDGDNGDLIHTMTVHVKHEDPVKKAARKKKPAGR